MIKWVFYKKILLHIKISWFSSNELTCYQRNRDTIPDRAKDYYEHDKKKRLREQARNKYRNLFEEAKNKKREYGKSRYRNMSEEKK